MTEQQLQGKRDANKRYHAKNKHNPEYIERRKRVRLRCYAKTHSPERKWKEHLKYSFGLTVEQYDEKLVEQNGLCAICNKPETIRRLGKLKNWRLTMIIPPIWSEIFCVATAISP